jgi:hypothetical protein
MTWKYIFVDKTDNNIQIPLYPVSPLTRNGDPNLPSNLEHDKYRKHLFRLPDRANWTIGDFFPRGTPNVKDLRDCPLIPNDRYGLRFEGLNMDWSNFGKERIPLLTGNNPVWGFETFWEYNGGFNPGALHQEILNTIGTLPRVAYNLLTF